MCVSRHTSLHAWYNRLLQSTLNNEHRVIIHMQKLLYEGVFHMFQRTTAPASVENPPERGRSQGCQRMWADVESTPASLRCLSMNRTGGPISPVSARRKSNGQELRAVVQQTAVDGEDPSRRIDVVPGDQGELTAPFPEQVFLGRRKLAVRFGTSGSSAGLVCLVALSSLFIGMAAGESRRVTRVTSLTRTPRLWRLRPAALQVYFRLDIHTWQCTCSC
jgi:hypothetical protein